MIYYSAYYYTCHVDAMLYVFCKCFLMLYNYIMQTLYSIIYGVGGNIYIYYIYVYMQWKGIVIS